MNVKDLAVIAVANEWDTYRLLDLFATEESRPEMDRLNWSVEEVISAAIDEGDDHEWIEEMVSEPPLW